MAQKSRPDPASGSVVTADEYEALGIGFLEDGLLGSPTDTATVFADSTGRQVKVRAGKLGNVRGYQWFSDPTVDEIIASLPANTSGNPRIDRLVLRLDRATRTVRTQYLQGTAAASPSAPALTQNTSLSSGLYDFPLARWQIANGYTTITAGDIVTEAWYPQPSGLTLCTSTSRPFGTSRTVGMEVYETNTKQTWSWDGSWWRPRPGTCLLDLTSAALNITNLDNGRRSVWTYSFAPPCPGTYNVRTLTPFDGVAAEEAKIYLNIAAVDHDLTMIAFAAGSQITEVPLSARINVASTAAVAMGVDSVRTLGGSFFASRGFGRKLTIDYMGPEGISASG